LLFDLLPAFEFESALIIGCGLVIVDLGQSAQVATVNGELSEPFYDLSVMADYVHDFTTA